MDTTRKLWQLIREAIEGEMNRARDAFETGGDNQEKTSEEYQFASWLLTAFGSKKPTFFTSPEDVTGKTIELVGNAPKSTAFREEFIFKYTRIIRERYGRVTGKDFQG